MSALHLPLGKSHLQEWLTGVTRERLHETQSAMVCHKNALMFFVKGVHV